MYTADFTPSLSYLPYEAKLYEEGVVKNTKSKLNKKIFVTYLLAVRRYLIGDNNHTVNFSVCWLKCLAFGSW